MTVLDIWNKISSHQITGLMHHFQFADTFYFLGLDALGRDQECRYREESDSVRKNHRFVLEHHNKLIDARHAQGVDLIPSNWFKYSISDVDKTTRRTQIAAVFDAWAGWEVKTKELYAEMYYRLTEMHAVADACRVKEMILSVEEELVRIHKCINKLKMHDYSVEAMLSL